MKAWHIVFFVVVAGFAGFGILSDPPKDTKSLIADLEHPSAERRASAVQLLGSRKEASAVPGLIARFGDPGEVTIRTKSGNETQWRNVRYTIDSLTIDALRFMDRAVVVPPLIDALGSPSKETRDRAYFTLTLMFEPPHPAQNQEQWRQWWAKNKDRFPPSQ